MLRLSPLPLAPAPGLFCFHLANYRTRLLSGLAWKKLLERRRMIWLAKRSLTLEGLLSLEVQDLVPKLWASHTLGQLPVEQVVAKLVASEVDTQGALRARRACSLHYLLSPQREPACANK